MPEICFTDIDPEHNKDPKHQKFQTLKSTILIYQWFWKSGWKGHSLYFHSPTHIHGIAKSIMLYFNNLSVTDQLRWKKNVLQSCGFVFFFSFAALQSEILAAVGAATAIATYSFSTSPHRKSHHSGPYHSSLAYSHTTQSNFSYFSFFVSRWRPLSLQMSVCVVSLWSQSHFHHLPVICFKFHLILNKCTRPCPACTKQEPFKNKTLEATANNNWNLFPKVPSKQ